MPLVYQAFNWSSRRLHRRHHGLRNDRRRRRRRRQGAPRSHGHAAVLRLPHGRLFPPLAQDAAQAQRNRRAFSTSTGSARTPTANSSGPASAKTCACSNGSSTAPAAARMGKETPIGWMPRYEDIDWNGLDFPKEKFDELQAFDRDAWRTRSHRPRGAVHRPPRPSAAGDDLRARTADLPDVMGLM